MSTIELPADVRDRFEAFVQKQTGPDGHWIWTGSRHDGGYGQLFVDGRPQKAHRVAWALYGLLHEGEVLRNVCGEPGCVRPDHWTLAEWSLPPTRPGAGPQDGTPWLEGTRNPGARFTEEQVRVIRKLHADGVATADITALLGAPYVRVWRVVTGRTYVNVE